MNSHQTPSPESSLLAQKSQGRARVKVAVFSVLAVHVAGFMALLMTQGCKRETHQDTTPVETPPPSIVDTNPPPMDAFPTNPPAGGTTALPGAGTEVPMQPAGVAVPPVTAPTKYVVQQGDSFYTIAKAHGVSQKAIEAANPGVDPKKLKPKQEINLPAPTPAQTTSAAPTVAPANGEIIHTVKSGDNLINIAKHYGTTVKAIKALNGLTTDKISVNQKLKIPAKAAPAPVAPEIPPAPMAPEATPPAAPPVTPPAR